MDGMDVGSYADFNFFRNAVTDLLEDGIPGNKYPTLILHSDCDGVWNPSQCIELESELRSITAAFQEIPPFEIHAERQIGVATSLGLRPMNLNDSFIDVDGEPLLERLSKLCQMAQDRDQPILFQ
jgi:hypothetical protein